MRVEAEEEFRMRARVLETWEVGLEVVPSAGEKAAREGGEFVLTVDRFDGAVGQESGEGIQQSAGHLAYRDHDCPMMPC